MIRRQHRLQPTKLHFEVLDARQLLAADIALVNGVLSIEGTGQADEIDVIRDSTSVVVHVGHGESQQTRIFPARDVREIVARGDEGDDRIFNGTDIPATIEGGDGDDILIAGSSRDVINAGRGSDLVLAGEGNDLVYGGEGNDQIYGGRGHDRVFAEAGNDTLLGEAGIDVLDGGSGHDEIFGGEDMDWLYGGSGNDLLSGNSHTDLLYGGTGDDRLFGGGAGDYLDGEIGDDRMVGGSGHDSIQDGIGWNLVVAEGSDGADEPHEAAEQSITLHVSAARDRWSSAGFDVVELANVRYRVSNLPGSNVALATREADGSQTIWLDFDAAGQGWFLDATPSDDVEFIPIGQGMLLAHAGGDAAGKSDLLTVLSHEMGHVLGWGHTSDLHVMLPVSLPGVRFVPHADLLQGSDTLLRGPFVEPLLNTWLNGVREYGNAGSAALYSPVGGLGFSSQDLNWLFLSPNSPFSTRPNYLLPSYYSPYNYRPAYYYNPYAYNPLTGMGYGATGVFGFAG